MLTVAVDMDDVLVDLLRTWINCLNLQYDTNVKYEDIKEWDMRKSFPNLTDKQIFGILNKEDFWKLVKPLNNTPKVLEEMCKNYNVKIVTASHPNTIKAKLYNALFPHFKFLTYRDVITCYDKCMIKANVLIDDYPENFRDFDGVKILIDAPYNVNCDENEYHFRAKNLAEAYEIVKQYERALYF